MDQILEIQEKGMRTHQTNPSVNQILFVKNIVILFTNPSAQAGYDTRSIF